MKRSSKTAFILHILNLAEENIKKLAAMFPSTVTEAINEDGKVVRAIDANIQAVENIN